MQNAEHKFRPGTIGLQIYTYLSESQRLAYSRNHCRKCHLLPCLEVICLLLSQFFFFFLAPAEIITLGINAKVLYEKALRDGAVNVYRGRILFLGQDRAGKTSLKKSLLGLPFDPKEQSTEGIEVDPSMCKIEVDQIKNWRSTRENKPGLSEFSKEISRMLAEKRYHAILSADSGREDEEKRPAGDLMNQVCTFLHTKTSIFIKFKDPE